MSYDPNGAFRTGECHLSRNSQSLNVEKCLRLDSDRPNYLLVGDSHAAMLWLGLSKALPDVNLMQASAGWCRPVASPSGPFATPACKRLMHLVYDNFLVEKKIDKVILSASWKDEDSAPLAASLDELKARGIDVIVLGPIVEYRSSLPRLLANQIMYGTPGLAASMQDRGIAGRDAAMRHMANAKGAAYVSLYNVVCPKGVCEVFAHDEIPLEFDVGHLTREGSRRVGQQIVEARAFE